MEFEEKLTDIFSGFYKSKLSANDLFNLNNRLIDIEARLDKFGFKKAEIWDAFPYDPKFSYEEWDDNRTEEEWERLHEVFQNTVFSQWVLSDLIFPGLVFYEEACPDHEMIGYTSIEECKKQGFKYDLNNYNEVFHELFLPDMIN